MGRELKVRPWPRPSVSPVIGKESVLGTHRYFSTLTYMETSEPFWSAGHGFLRSIDTFRRYLRNHSDYRLLMDFRNPYVPKLKDVFPRWKKNAIILHTSFPVCSLFCNWVEGGLHVSVLGWWRWITSPSENTDCYERGRRKMVTDMSIVVSCQRKIVWTEYIAMGGGRWIYRTFYIEHEISSCV